MTATQPAAADAPFGRMLTAMITPMTADGGVDYDGAARLATYLVDEMRNDGLASPATAAKAVAGLGVAGAAALVGWLQKRPRS